MMSKEEDTISQTDACFVKLKNIKIDISIFYFKVCFYIILILN